MERKKKSNVTSSKCTECGEEYPDGCFNIRQHRDIKGPVLCRSCESKRVHGTKKGET